MPPEASWETGDAHPTSLDSHQLPLSTQPCGGWASWLWGTSRNHTVNQACRDITGEWQPLAVPRSLGAWCGDIRQADTASLHVWAGLLSVRAGPSVSNTRRCCDASASASEDPWMLPRGGSWRRVSSNCSHYCLGWRHAEHKAFSRPLTG